MFIIFGTPRSGTTIFAETLNSHPEITIPPETDFIVPLVFIYTRIQDPILGREMIANLITSSGAYERSIAPYLDTDMVRQIVYDSEYRASAILENIYAAIAAHSGADIAGDKSPNDLDYLKILVETETLSGIKILHLVRDVRDLMVSLNQTGWLGDADDYFPRFWSNNNLYLHTKFSQYPERYQLVRYEDMVRDPAGVFGQVCSFLGVDYRDSILSPDVRPRRYPDRLNLQKEIYSERTGVYRRSLPASMLASYEQQAGECLEAFGYTLETGPGSTSRTGSLESTLVNDIPCKDGSRLVITDQAIIIRGEGNMQHPVMPRRIPLNQVSSISYHPAPFFRSPALEIQHQLPGGTQNRFQVQFGNLLSRVHYRIKTGFSPHNVYELLREQVEGSR